MRAGDLGRRRDAILAAASDGEHDRERRVRGVPADGDVGPPVALLPQIVLDSRFGILEQILVDRAFTVERGELLEAVRRQCVALEAHADGQTGVDADDEVDAPAIVAGDELQRTVGLVESSFLEAPHVGVEMLLNARPHEYVAGLRLQPAQELFARNQRVLLDRHFPDHGARSRIDAERQQRAVRIVLNLRRRLDLGAEIPMIRIELLERSYGGVDAPDGRRRAVALDDGVAEETGREPQSAGEIDALNIVERDQSEAQRHTSARPLSGLDLNILEAPEAVDMSDRFAHRGSRQGVTDSYLDQVVDRRVRGRPLLDEQPHLFDRSAQVQTGGRLGACRYCTEGREEREGEQPRPAKDSGPHQNLCRTRKSSAYVPSPTWVTTQPRRSFWSYSRMIT